MQIEARLPTVRAERTVAFLLQQVAAGTLELKSTIGEILPDLAARYPDIEDITVEQLAGMTSGIQDYANAAVIIERVIKDPTQTLTADDLIDGPMTLPLSPPGTGGYSTTNTIILGQMLEELTGKPVDEVVTEVARSVGMADTALARADVNTMPQPSSRGYVESLGAEAIAVLGLDVPPGTDVNSRPTASSMRTRSPGPRRTVTTPSSWIWSRSDRRPTTRCSATRRRTPTR